MSLLQYRTKLWLGLHIRNPSHFRPTTADKFMETIKSKDFKIKLRIEVYHVIEDKFIESPSPPFKISKIESLWLIYGWTLTCFCLEAAISVADPDPDPVFLGHPDPVPGKYRIRIRILYPQKDPCNSNLSFILCVIRCLSLVWKCH